MPRNRSLAPRLLRTLLTLAFAASVSGCAVFQTPAPVAYDPHGKQQAVTVVINAPDGVRRHSTVTNVTDVSSPSAAVVSGIMSLGMNKVFNSISQGPMVPIVTATRDLDVIQLVQEAVRDAPPAAPWLSYEQVMDVASLPLGADNLPQIPVLVLSNDYVVTRDFKRLAVLTVARLYLGEPIQPVYQGRFTTLTADLLPPRSGSRALIDTWAADEGAAVAQHIRQGIRQNLHMLALHLSAPTDDKGVAQLVPDRSHKVRFYNALERSATTYRVVEAGTDFTVTQTKSGRLLSAPNDIVKRDRRSALWRIFFP